VKYETIKNCGELGIEFYDIRGRGAIVTRDFLRELLRHVVVRCARMLFYLESMCFPNIQIICMKIPAYRKSYASFNWPDITRRPAIAIAMLGGFFAIIRTIVLIKPSPPQDSISHC